MFVIFCETFLRLLVNSCCKRGAVAISPPQIQARLPGSVQWGGFSVHHLRFTEAVRYSALLQPDDVHYNFFLSEERAYGYLKYSFLL